MGIVTVTTKEAKALFDLTTKLQVMIEDHVKATDAELVGLGSVLDMRDTVLELQRLLAQTLDIVE